MNIVQHVIPTTVTFDRFRVRVTGKQLHKRKRIFSRAHCSLRVLYVFNRKSVEYLCINAIRVQHVLRRSNVFITRVVRHAAKTKILLLLYIGFLSLAVTNGDTARETQRLQCFFPYFCA